MSHDDSLLDPALPVDCKSPSAFSGQPLFVRGSDWQNNAMLGWTPFPMDLYATGYKNAADGLLFALANRRASLDSVIYPLVFLYRQGLELQLKLMLPLARRLADVPDRSDHSHSLMPMWNELRALVEQLVPVDGDKELPAMEDFIQQMDKVDPQSFAFRYPTTKKGEISVPDLRHINVRHLSEVMDSVFMMLGGTYSVLGELVQGDGHEEW